MEHHLIVRVSSLMSSKWRYEMNRGSVELIKNVLHIYFDKIVVA